MSSYTVYVATHDPTKRHYVGHTKNLTRRICEHRYGATQEYKRNCSRFHSALHELGEGQFKYQGIEEYETRAEAEEAESFWIEFLRSNDIDFGFNTESGGNAGKRLSEAQKAKMAATKTGVHASEQARANMRAASLASDAVKAHNEAQRGKSHPQWVKDKIHCRMSDPEVKARMSAAQLGKRRTPEQIDAQRIRKTGLRHSEETKAKMREAQRARFASDPKPKPKSLARILLLSVLSARKE